MPIPRLQKNSKKHNSTKIKLEAHRISLENIYCENDGEPLFKPQAFIIGSGQIIVIRGKNGSGKSLLLRSICNTSNCLRGSIKWNKQNTTTSNCAQKCMRIGHNPPFLHSLTLFENLQFWAQILAQKPENKAENLEKAMQNFALQSFWHSPTQRLSAGQKQRGALAMLMLKPHACVWLLDEPHAALDLNAKQNLNEQIKNHLNNNGSVIIASHDKLNELNHTSVTLKHHSKALSLR